MTSQRRGDLRDTALAAYAKERDSTDADLGEPEPSADLQRLIRLAEADSEIILSRRVTGWEFANLRLVSRTQNAQCVVASLLDCGELLLLYVGLSPDPGSTDLLRLQALWPCDGHQHTLAIRSRADLGKALSWTPVVCLRSLVTGRGDTEICWLDLWKGRE
jgi:hypothetical protein